MALAKIHDHKEKKQALARPTFGFELFEDLGFPFTGMRLFDQLERFPFLREMEANAFPKMDVFEKKGKLMVKTELPGVDRDHVEVTVDDGFLTIEGERTMDKEDETDGRVYRRETAYGKFFRKLPLGFEVEPDKVKAKFKNGMLSLEIPMPPEATTKPKKQKVAIA